MARDMAWASRIGQIKRDTKVNGTITKCMAMVTSNIQKMIYIKDISSIIKDMAKEEWSGSNKRYMKV